RGGPPTVPPRAAVPTIPHPLLLPCATRRLSALCASGNCPGQREHDIYCCISDGMDQTDCRQIAWTGDMMNKNEILARIESEAATYYLPATTALDAYIDILAGLAARLDDDDLGALIAIGTVLTRQAHLSCEDVLSRAPRAQQC
ncbi:conserved hypothetical protein, partial [Ricinus communis]